MYAIILVKTWVNLLGQTYAAVFKSNVNFIMVQVIKCFKSQIIINNVCRS